KTIALFDQSTLSEARIRFFPLSHANAATVAGDLTELIKASGTSSVAIAPMRRLNGIFAFSQSSDVLAHVGQWVTRLDVPSQDQSIRVWVYHPRGASAENLVRTLNAIVGNGPDLMQPTATSPTSGNAGGGAQSPVPAPAPGLASGVNGAETVRIVAD